MSEEKRPREFFVPVWGIFLLCLGVVLLLQALNVLPWALWETLWRFWPVLIIVIGLSLLLRRLNVWLTSGIILALFLACLGTAIWLYQPSTAGPITRSYSEPLGNLQQVEAQLNFNMGNLNLGSLPSGSINLVEVDSTGRNGQAGLTADFRRQGIQGMLYLNKEKTDWQIWNKEEIKWWVKLNRDVSLTLTVNSAVGTADLDLSQLQVTELRMDIDLGNFVVKLPLSGITQVHIKADLANLEVIIPQGMAARVKAEVDLGTLNIDETRFPKTGDYYQSPDFNTAQNRIELELDCALAAVQVR